MINEIVVIAIVAYVIAGFVKGTIGIGLPTAAISLFAQASGDARLAISLVIVPMIATNAWQCWRSDRFVQTMLRYRWLASVMSVCIGVTAIGVSNFSSQAVTLMLGVAITLFALTSLWREWPVLPARLDRVAQIVTGVCCGVMGGLAGVWAPPIVIYLASLRLDKDAFVRATGVLLLIGSVVLAISYGANGLLTPRQSMLGGLLVVPALGGYWLGEVLRERLSGPLFKKVVLVFFLLMGLNLIRRGALGL